MKVNSGRQTAADLWCLRQVHYSQSFHYCCCMSWEQARCVELQEQCQSTYSLIIIITNFYELPMVNLNYDEPICKYSKVKSSSCQVVHTIRAYPGFCSRRQIGVFLHVFLPGWHSSPSNTGFPPGIKFGDTHLYPWRRKALWKLSTGILPRTQLNDRS